MKKTVITLGVLLVILMLVLGTIVVVCARDKDNNGVSEGDPWQDDDGCEAHFKSGPDRGPRDRVLPDPDGDPWQD